MSENNLRINWQNTYWRCTDQIDIYQLVGSTPSNTYFGSSQVYGNIYEFTATSPGDEIHALAGGTFHVYVDGDDDTLKVRQVKLSLSDKHPFEKVYVSRQEEWPLDKLQHITDPTKPDSYRNEDDKVTLDEALFNGATIYGRSLDYVY